MTTTEAVKLALEALENAEYGDYDKKELNKAITALREALASEAIEQPAQQPAQQQEPVGAVTVSHYKGLENRDFDYWGSLPDGTHNLYTSPPASKPWVGLTDEEILSVARDHYNPHQRPEISFARAIEAKLKEKNCG